MMDDKGLLTQDEQVLLRRIERSQVWRLIRDSLCYERENLFGGHSDIPGLTGQPEGVEALMRNRGAILLIQHLLQEGPKLVIWYRRYMAAQAEQKVREKGSPRTPDREFSRDEHDERPDFDI